MHTVSKPQLVLSWSIPAMKNAWRWTKKAEMEYGKIQGNQF